MEFGHNFQESVESANFNTELLLYHSIDETPRKYKQHVKNHFKDGDTVAAVVDGVLRETCALMLLRKYEGILHVLRFIPSINKNEIFEDLDKADVMSMLPHLKSAYGELNIVVYANIDTIQLFFELGFCFYGEKYFDPIEQNILFCLSLPPSIVQHNRQKFGRGDVIRAWVGGNGISPMHEMKADYRKTLKRSSVLCDGATTACVSKGIHWSYVTHGFNQQDIIFVAETTKGDIKGIACCQIRQAESTLYIDALCSNVGAGSSLLVAAAQYAKTRNLQYIKLDSVQGAFSFYFRWSFTFQEPLKASLRQMSDVDTITNFTRLEHLDYPEMGTDTNKILELAKKRNTYIGQLYSHHDDIPITYDELRRVPRFIYCVQNRGKKYPDAVYRLKSSAVYHVQQLYILSFTNFEVVKMTEDEVFERKKPPPAVTRDSFKYLVSKQLHKQVVDTDHYTQAQAVFFALSECAHSDLYADVSYQIVKK
jgi:hypothetical protein